MLSSRHTGLQFLVELENTCYCLLYSLLHNENKLSLQSMFAFTIYLVVKYKDSVIFCNSQFDDIDLVSFTNELFHTVCIVCCIECFPRSTESGCHYVMNILSVRHENGVENRSCTDRTTPFSRPSLCARRIIGHCRMYEWRAKARMILCACAGWSEYAHLSMFECTYFAWCDPYLSCFTVEFILLHCRIHLASL